MADIMAEEPIRIRDCACPGAPHPDGDLVRLRPKLPAVAGAEASTVLYLNPDPARRQGLLYGVLLVGGIGWWNLLDAKKRPVSINEQTVLEEIDWGGGGKQLFNVVMERYGEALFGRPNADEADETAPLVPSESSSSGPTAGSTSATPESSEKPPRPSKSSSPTSTAPTT